jgi:hypothetical protein
MGGVTRDGYSDREKAIRAEIERQAPDLKLKYAFDLDYGRKVGVAFDFGAGPVCFQALNAEIADAGMVAAQCIGAARYLRDKFSDASDVTNWATP